MWCKMDVDDAFVPDPREWRRIGCDCAAVPVPALVAFGCRCDACGATCRECPGFGYVAPPARSCQEILSRVAAGINRRVRSRGRPPGYVRLAGSEVGVLLRKRRVESADHWIRECVDPGPPVRVFDVLVVVDRRQR